MKPKALLLSALLVAAPAWAQAPAAPTTDGSATRAWMALQKGDEGTVSTPRPQSGEEAERVYQRYLDSFDHPIPEAFDRERFNSGSQSR